MSQYQRNEPDLTKYEPLPGEPALEDALWSTGDMMYKLIRLRAHHT